MLTLPETQQFLCWFGICAGFLPTSSMGRSDGNWEKKLSLLRSQANMLAHSALEQQVYQTQHYPPVRHCWETLLNQGLNSCKTHTCTDTHTHSLFPSLKDQASLPAGNDQLASSSSSKCWILNFVCWKKGASQGKEKHFPDIFVLMPPGL